MVLFPFEYDVDKGLLAQNDEFDIGTFGEIGRAHV